MTCSRASVLDDGISHMHDPIKKTSRILQDQYFRLGSSRVGSCASALGAQPQSAVLDNGQFSGTSCKQRCEQSSGRERAEGCRGSDGRRLMSAVEQSWVQVKHSVCLQENISTGPAIDLMDDL